MKTMIGKIKDAICDVNWPVVLTICTMATLVSVPFGLWQHSEWAGVFAWVITAFVLLVME